MTAKRQAQYIIDQKTEDYLQAAATQRRQPQAGAKPRTIVEVKRDADGPVIKITEENKPKGFFKFEARAPDYKFFPNLFGSNINKCEDNKEGTTTGQQNRPNKPYNKPGGIFSNFKRNEVKLHNPFGQLKTSAVPSMPYFSNRRPNDDDTYSDQLQRQQNMKVEKQKSTGHYDYKQEVKLIFTCAAKKYRKDNERMIQNVEVNLQQEIQNNMFYLVIRLSATKHIIFAGVLLKNKSQVRCLYEKSQSLQISAAVVKVGKIQFHKIKVKIDTPENGKLLFAKLEQVIHGQVDKKQSESKEQSKGEQVVPTKKDQEKSDSPVTQAKETTADLKNTKEQEEKSDLESKQLKDAEEKPNEEQKKEEVESKE